MAEELFAERRRALEEEFFLRHNEALLESMRAERERDHARAALADATGMPGSAVVDELLDLGLSAATLTALALVPLVAVAWADGRLEPRERDAITGAAAESGIAAGTASRVILDSWLVVAPEPALLDAWLDYVGDLRPRLGAEALTTLREQTLGRARAVAEAAGGYLGIGPHVSHEEAAILGRIAAAFEG